MARINILTYGCASNQADSEHLTGLLEQDGHVMVGDDDEADVIVVNTCTVKTPTELKIVKRLRQYEQAGVRVVVAGCMPAARKSMTVDFPSFSFIGTNVSDIVEAVDEALAGNCYESISAPRMKMGMPKVRRNRFVEIIPVAEGCLGSCNYCLTRSARGALKSYPIADIVERVKVAASSGVRELWLTGQDTGAYGMDSCSSLPVLLNSVTGVGGDFRVRVGMMNPDHTLAILDELLDSFESEKVYRFVHIPLQSGSDKVLEDMGRRYSVKDFLMVCEKFRQRFDATISTDIICGYPTESEDDFDDTVIAVEALKPDVLNVSRFWARPGTPAAGLKQHPGRVTKERSRIMNKVFKRIGLERNSRWKGWEGEAIVSGMNPDGTFTARNTHYKPIIIKGENLLGDTVNVGVTDCTYYDLRGHYEKK